MRKGTGYKGVIFSDDLEMGAIRRNLFSSVKRAVKKTVEAGHDDMLLACHDMSAQKEVFHALVEAYKSKRLSAQENEESLQRITMLTAKRTERFAALPAT